MSPGWPEDLPMADLISCRMAPTASGQLQPTIYVMLPEALLDSLEERFIYRRFLFAREPHPTLLWAMALAPTGRLTDNVRWLRAFFDLQAPTDRHFLQQLCREPSHPLLFYARETRRLTRRFLLKLEFQQRHLLESWLLLATQLHAGNPTVARHRLREQLEQLKPALLIEIGRLYH